MARDRKRAKQRRERAGGRGPRTAEPPTPPVRADVPGSLDHASSDVDEFDAALLRGAAGVPLTEESELPVDDRGEAVQAAEPAPPGAEDILEPPAPPAPPGRGGGGGGGGGGPPEERPSGAPLRAGNKAIGFLRASWAELQRVQWPDRRQVFQATAVVLGFVAVAGAYLGLADLIAKEIVEAIL